MSDEAEYYRLVAYWRKTAKELDEHKVTNPQNATMKIQYQSCRETFETCARDLEKLVNSGRPPKETK